ncbi:MAG: XdhC family protein [Thermoflavifilum sp.]|nr:XdhC family protein [Thermoflavifilum sp.]MCL6514576.1 XdhC family protein [Alicyclobacillus sp.]
MLEVVQALTSCVERGTRAVLATIIDVEGSAYRREGVRALIHEDGSIVGVVSGGCVERDLAEHARAVLENGEPREVFYDFRAAEDLLWGMGVGCNGAITLWLEPFDPVAQRERAAATLAALRRRLETTQPYRTLTILRSPDGSPVFPGQILEEPDGTDGVDWASLPAQGLVDTSVQGVTVRAFVETVRPRPRLVVFGAGADAMPVVRTASGLGWHVTVVDHRPERMSRTHFPTADDLALRPRHAYTQGLMLGESTYTVIMTHNYEIDMHLLSSLLPLPIPYIGLLGPRKRLEQMLMDLEQTGHKVDSAHLEKLYSPVGLDIGAESPEDIAISIIAEIQAVRSGRQGGFLRTRRDPLHARSQVNHAASGPAANAAGGGTRCGL